MSSESVSYGGETTASTSNFPMTVTVVMPPPPSGPSTTEMVTLGGAVGAGIGADILLTRFGGIALASEGTVVSIATASLAGVVASGVVGYEIGTALNKLSFVQAAAAAAVTGLMDGLQSTGSYLAQLGSNATIAAMGMPSSHDIADIVSHNASEGSYTSGTDILACGFSQSGHDPSTIFLWP